jgi:serine/threonine-protein kinase
MSHSESDASAFDETIIGSIPGVEASFLAPRSGARVELISGSSPGMETETQALLRIRLRAAAIVLLAAVVAFYIRGFFVSDAAARGAQAGISLVMAAIVAALSSWRAFSLAQLRRFEVGIFSLLTLYLGYYQYELVLVKARAGNPIFELAAIKSCILYFFAVILLYGTFVPNTWQRAARIIVPLALMPFFVMGLLRLNSPAVNDIAGQVTNFEQISDNVIMMTLGAAASLYGTHIINALRVEAFKARQMGQYHLKERLGAGGMGEVYLAEHSLLKRPCAIKLIRPESQTDPAAILRFEREVRATAGLSHWNTVNIFDYGRTDDGTFYYVMEYLRGLNLAELVRRHGPLPPARAIHLLRQTCRALQEAHAAGLIHRDIKPANLFAARMGGVFDVAKLLDFGLVKQSTDDPGRQIPQTGTFSGSPLYMAPEQAASGPAPDARSDIYSLGATAYYLLTGKAPFDGKNVMEVMIAHARRPVVPFSQVCADVPFDLEQVVLRCLAKDPADRFADAMSLEQGLARCADADRWADADAERWWREKESLGLRA